MFSGTDNNGYKREGRFHHHFILLLVARVQRKSVKPKHIGIMPGSEIVVEANFGLVGVYIGVSVGAVCALICTICILYLFCDVCRKNRNAPVSVQFGAESVVDFCF